jgi:hypothetical protein
MAADDAMNTYVESIKQVGIQSINDSSCCQIVETMPVTENVEDFLAKTQNVDQMYEEAINLHLQIPQIASYKKQSNNKAPVVAHMNGNNSRGDGEDGDTSSSEDGHPENGQRRMLDLRNASAGTGQTCSLFVT